MARGDVQRRTRRTASAIQGAARDTAVGRLTRLRAGAFPLSRHTCGKRGAGEIPTLNVFSFCIRNFVTPIIESVGTPARITPYPTGRLFEVALSQARSASGVSTFREG